MMDLQACTEALRTRAGDDSGLGATLKFDCGSDGVIYIDGQSTPNTVSNDNKEADCVVEVTLDNLNKLMSGELNPANAFMMGKIKVSGDMSVALKLQRLM